MGDGRPVRMAELFTVGRNDEMVAADDVQQFVARIMLAAVMRNLHKVDLQRVFFRIALRPQVSLHVMGITVAQHQDAQTVAAQDEGDAGGIGQFARRLQVRRFRGVFGQFLQRNRQFVHIYPLRLQLRFRARLLLLLDHHAAYFGSRRDDLDAPERILLDDALLDIIPPCHLPRLGQRVQQFRQFRALQGAFRHHVFHLHIPGAIGPDLLGGEDALHHAGVDVLRQASDVVVIVMGQYQEVGDPGFAHLAFQHTAATRRAAVHHDDAVLTRLITLDDEGVAVFYR